jgi:hypothetical protein
MNRVRTEEEALMEREGYGRFNLRRSAEVHPVNRRTRTGPSRVITTRPTRTLASTGVDRTKYLPKLVKDTEGNDVRMMVKVR